MFKRGGTPNTGIMDGFGEDRVMAQAGLYTGQMPQGFTAAEDEVVPTMTPSPTATTPVFTPREAPDEPLFGLSDYASLFKLGANIASAPGRGTGLGGVLAAAGPSLALAADEFAASQEAKAARRREFEATEQGRRDAFDAARREEQFRESLLDKEIEGKIKLAEREPLEKEFILNKAQELREKIASGDPKLVEEAKMDMEVLYPERAKAKFREMEEARNEGWKKFEDVADGIVERLEAGTATDKEKELYTGKSSVEIATDIAIADVLSDYSFAEGGRVELQEGGQAMGMQGGDRSPELSFEELRARLPMEVTDQVVRLLATSEAALLDFANIDTQEDIAIFNQKYNVDLQLPVQAV